jgi:hypothetical protein
MVAQTHITNNNILQTVVLHRIILDGGEKDIVGLDFGHFIDFGWRVVWSLLWVFGGRENWSLGDQSFDRPKSPFLGRLGGQ